MQWIACLAIRAAHEKAEDSSSANAAMILVVFSAVGYRCILFDLVGRHDDILTVCLAVPEIAQLFANDVHRLWCFNPNPYRVGANADNRDRNVVTD